MAPPTHSRPLSRPPISRGPNLFFTATFVESGRDNGHLAPLVDRPIAEPDSRYRAAFFKGGRGGGIGSGPETNTHSDGILIIVSV